MSVPHGIHRRRNTGAILCALTVPVLVLVLALITIPGVPAVPLSPEHPAIAYAEFPFPVRYSVDDVSAAYRTGAPDPAVSVVPSAISRELRSNPSAGIRRLADFFRHDGGAFGPARDDYHYVKRIHDWIAANVVYDTLLLNRTSGHIGSRYPEEFLVFPDGPRTTCGGYSRLFVSLAEAGGIEARYIGGLTRSYISVDGEIGDHAWNAVRINRRWYVVDTTAAAGTPSEPYNDSWLLVAPEAMLIRNIADDQTEQLISDPIVRDLFDGMPRVHPRFFRYGLIPLEGVSFAGLREERVRRYGSPWYDRYDRYEFDSRGEKTFSFLAPRETYVTATLYDETGASVPDRAFVTWERASDGYRHTTVRFSAPGPGRFRGVIRARGIDDAGPSWSVYGFSLLSAGEQGGAVPEAGILYRDQRIDRYEVSIGELQSPTERTPYWSLDVTMGDGVDVAAGIRGVDTPDPEGHRWFSYVDGRRKTLYVTPPPPGEYDVILWARRTGAERYTDRIGQFRIRSAEAGDDMLPAGVVRRTGRYHEYGVRLLAIDTDTDRSTGDTETRISLVYPPDVVITSAILDPQGASRDPRTGDRYTRTFRRIERPGEGRIDLVVTTPAGNGAWRFRVYGSRAGEDGSWTLIETRLPSEAGER